MSEFSPISLVQATGGRWHGGEPEFIKGFAFDARQLKPGECFVALSGGVRDGHDFIEQAIERVAAAAITERVLDVGLPQLVVADSLLAMGAIGADFRQQFKRPVVGITGSCGKTSTKEMLRRLLGEERTHATAGNWNNRIGVPMTLFGLDPRQQDFAVIEAGINQPGEMALLGAMIRADLTILTNIGPAHLELLGSLDGIASEKSQLARLAASDSPIILPVGALAYAAYFEMRERCIVLAGETQSVPDGVRRVVRFSSKPSAGMSRTLRVGADQYCVHSTSAGMAANSALAIVAAQELGVDPRLLTERIGAWRPESTRGRIIEQGGNFFYIDCYNANPASMADALLAFCEAAPTGLARCFVLGVMNELGSATKELHRSLGQQVQLRSEDRAYFVGPGAITACYLTGAMEAGACAAQLECAENVGEIKSAVADFTGALFLKGSRSHQLEKLLPESIRTT